MEINLQYTLLLLIQHINQFTTAEIKDLHYTLLLLIQSLSDEEFETVDKFTLHFATINTFTVIAKISSISLFTLHFATINTVTNAPGLARILHLHYTLLLLIQNLSYIRIFISGIYITLCYY